MDHLTCKTARLDAYLDRELNPGEEQRVLDHLRECDSCRDGVSEMGLLTTMISEPVSPVSAAFVRATCDRALATRWPKSPLLWVSVPLTWRVGLATAVLLATFAGYLAGRGQPQGLQAAEELAAVLDSPEVAALDLDYANSQNGGRR